jgi:hypothetical protein
VRATARTAQSPGELPSAPDLLADIAHLFGVDRGAFGYAQAETSPEAIGIPRSQPAGSTS